MMHHFLYRTENLVNKKYYIGVHSTEQIEDGYLGSGTLLLKAIKKYGRENFKRTIMKFAHNREHAFELEKTVVTERFVRSPKTYNISLGGRGAINPDGHTEEAKRKISEAAKGNKRCLGRKVSEETKRKISEAQKGSKNHQYGKPCSVETRKKISESQKGKVVSAETRKKMSEASKGRTSSAETRKKLSEAAKGHKRCVGRKLSEETRRKIGEANKGRTPSAETRKKMSMSHRSTSGILGVQVYRATKIRAGEEYLYERWLACRKNGKTKKFPFTDEGKQQAAAWIAAEGDD